MLAIRRPVFFAFGLVVLLLRPVFGQQQFEVLVLSIPNKYHYEYIAPARESFRRMSEHHNFALTWTNDPGVFDGALKKYAAIVFINTPGEVLNDSQRAHLQDYVHQGGGVVAIHKAIATARGWPWFERLLGQSFRIHPIIQTAVVNVIDRNFPATMPLPDKWVWSDEWYEYDPPSTPDLHVIMTVDETTYDPTRIWPGQKASGMGAFHPVAWYHLFEGGRVFATALGHMPELYTDKLYLDHLYGGIYWAATGRGVAAPPAHDATKPPTASTAPAQP